MSYKSEVEADNPSAWFRLGEPSGTAALDAKGGAAGTYSGGFTLGAAGLLTSEPSNTAVDLDGSTGKITVADREALDLGDVFTIEAWIKFDVGSRRNTIVAKGTNAYIFRVHENNKLLLGKDGVGALIESAATLSPGTVYHVAATKSGATRHVYINGAASDETVANQTCTDNATSLTLGATSSFFFDGIMDEVALYKTALSAARLKAHYEAGIASVAASLAMVI